MLIVFSEAEAYPATSINGRELRALTEAARLYGSRVYHIMADDRQQISELARRAAQRVGTPFIAVDLAQQEDGTWIVIEVGDGQFSGLSHVPVLELWSRLSDAIVVPVEDT